jgi:hypothetical protein
MKAKFNTVIAILAFATIGLATTTAFATDKNGTTVTTVYANQTTLLIRLASGHSGEGCADESHAIIRTGASFPTALQQYNNAVSAYLSGRKVNVRLTGCSGGYPVVTIMALMP